MVARWSSFRKVLLVWAICSLSIGVSTLGIARPASACSCAQWTDDEAFAAADAVFTGALIDIQTPPGDSYSSTDPERFVFDVDEVFKGDAFARQSIVTARDGASCGLEISGPGPFLVFAFTESDGITTGAADGEFYSNLCQGTRALASGAMPSTFNAGTPPVAGSSPVGSSETSSSTAPWIVSGAVLIAVVGAVALIAGRNRRHAADN